MWRALQFSRDDPQGGLYYLRLRWGPSKVRSWQLQASQSLVRRPTHHHPLHLHLLSCNLAGKPVRREEEMFHISISNFFQRKVTFTRGSREEILYNFIQQIFLIIYYVPGSILGPGHMSMNQRDYNLCSVTC